MRVVANPDSPLNSLPSSTGSLKPHYVVTSKLDNRREYRVTFYGDHPRAVDVVIPARKGRREIWRNLWLNGPEGLAPIGRTAALAVIRAERSLSSYDDDSRLFPGYHVYFRERKITETARTGKIPLPWSYFRPDGTLHGEFLTRAAAVAAARLDAIALGHSDET
jgi:hypothetical protein